MLPRRSLVLLSLLLASCSSGPESPASSAAGTGGAGGAGGGGGGAPPTGPLSGEVVAYEYTFALDTAEATARVHYGVAEPGGDCLTLACDLPSVDAVSWNDAPATLATLDGAALTACGVGVRAAEPLVVEAKGQVPEDNYFGLDVGFSRITNMDGGTFSYLLSWVGGCDHFGPCDDAPSKLVELSFDVTHAPTDVVLCPGVRTTSDGATHCEVKGTLAPTYSGFALAADPLWKKLSFGASSGVDFVFYEVPSGALAASLDPSRLDEFFTWLTGLLGPFPYGNELRFAGAPTKWLGFEHPANIVLREDMPDLVTSYGDTTMHVTMHEIIHQWAGDRTTLATAQDFVWKEAMAEYLAYVFEDEALSAEDAAASLAYWDSISLQAKYYPRPTDEPPPDVQKFYGDVYGPGPMTLFVQLEDLVGRPAVLAGIQSFLAQPAARSVDELKSALAASSGAELGPYFDAWVFGSGKPEWPTFAIATSQIGSEVTVDVTQQNDSGRLYGCRVEVQVAGATESAIAVVDFGLAPSSATASATVTLSEPVATTALDPNHRLVGRLAGGTAAPEPELPVYIF
jgi:aminopeptidase N